VEAVELENDIARVDKDWCIGCGVCVSKCSADAIAIRYREDKPLELPSDFNALYDKIEQERRS